MFLDFRHRRTLKSPLQPAVDEMVMRICSIIVQLANQDSQPSTHRLQSAPIGQMVTDLVSQGKKLIFILPAFPAKSPNRQKTIGDLPDFGEVLGLMRMQSLCENISSIYAPGAKVILCSDGRVFNDLVLVADDHIRTYQTEIRSIIETYQLSHLETFSLDECWPEESLTFSDMRKKLVDHFAPGVEQIRSQVRTSLDSQRIFNGIHRFIKEDRLALYPDKSRTAISNEAKEVAYLVMDRSQAWDKLLATRFPQTLRLSIHPYPIEHTKFGVELVRGYDRWCTPWHNVTAQIGDEFVLMKRSLAESLGGELKWMDGKYAFFTF